MPQAAVLPSRPPAHDAKRELLLDEAAREFNAHGIAGASFARIARRMGLTRAALYYYVPDREGLVVECYRASCATMADDLAAAAQMPGSGFERVVAFLRRSLDPERAARAILSELDYLKGEARAEIAAAHNANVAALRALLQSGMADGSVRRCDDEVAAQTLVGVLAWIPLSIDWVEGTDRTYRARTVDALIALLCDGEATDRGKRFLSPVEIRSFFAPPAGAFDREANQAAKIEELLRRASGLFNRRGIDGVSLDDVAAEVGATKGVLYHYFRNKPDLVVRCYRRAFSLYERFTDTADVLGRDGREKGAIGTWLNVQAHVSGLSPLIQLAGVEALPAAARREITKRARALQRRFEAFGHEGMKDGSFRPHDFGVVAQLGAGTFQWLPKWIRSDDGRAPGAIANEVVDWFALGLKAGS